MSQSEYTKIYTKRLDILILTAAMSILKAVYPELEFTIFCYEIYLNRKQNPGIGTVEA